MATGDAIIAESEAREAELYKPRPCRACGCEIEIRPHGLSRSFCSSQCRTRWRARQPGEAEKMRERRQRWEMKQNEPHPGQLRL